MSATEVVEIELGRNEESEEEAIELEVSEDELKAGAPITAKQAKEMVAFLHKKPKGEAPKTAREKKLAKQKKAVAKEIALLQQWGEALKMTHPWLSIRQGGRRRKVAPREALMAELLKIRNKRARLVVLNVNAAQRDFAAKAAPRSIVLKARQLGITTYVAARFFLNCITRPGTLCVQVAHDQRSAEAIFRIVHRLLANMPDWLRKGALATSHVNKRQIVFPHLEGLFGHKSGAEKKKTALTLAQNTIQATDAIAGKDILDPNKFQDGLGKVIDGVVQCLNSSAWAKAKAE